MTGKPILQNLTIEMIAPCGMNCAVCSAYLAYKHEIPKSRGKISHCRGCRPRQKECSFIKKRCHVFGKSSFKYCYECPDFACENLKYLDARYQKMYATSLIQNLIIIRNEGEGVFLENETKRWQCPTCGSMRCIHYGKCYRCDKITSWKG